MPEPVKAKEPFRFSTRLSLSELTGLKASNLNELLELTRQVPGGCIYHHTHRFLQQHQYLSPEPPNDFAYWVREILGEDDLGEMLAAIDTVQFSSIRDLREKINGTISHYLNENPSARKKFVKEGAEFHFIKSISFIIPTRYVAADLKEFVEILRMITIDAIYFHIFEAKLRLGKETNDFSMWIDQCMGDKELAQAIARLDPYTYAMEDLRKVIIRRIENKISHYAKT